MPQQLCGPAHLGTGHPTLAAALGRSNTAQDSPVTLANDARSFLDSATSASARPEPAVCTLVHLPPCWALAQAQPHSSSTSGSCLEQGPVAAAAATSPAATVPLPPC